MKISLLTVSAISMQEGAYSQLVLVCAELETVITEQIEIGRHIKARKAEVLAALMDRNGGKIGNNDTARKAAIETAHIADGQLCALLTQDEALSQRSAVLTSQKELLARRIEMIQTQIQGYASLLAAVGDLDTENVYTNSREASPSASDFQFDL